MDRTPTHIEEMIIEMDFMHTMEVENPCDKLFPSPARALPIVGSNETSDHSLIERETELDVAMHEEERDSVQEAIEIIEESKSAQISAQNFADEEAVELDSAGEEDNEPKIEDDEGYESGQDMDDEGQAITDFVREELSNVGETSPAGCDSEIDVHEIENRGGLDDATSYQRDEHSLKFTSYGIESLEDRMHHHQTSISSAWKDCIQAFAGTGYHVQPRKLLEMSQGTAPSPPNVPMDHLFRPTQAVSTGGLDVKKLLAALNTLEQTTKRAIKELEHQPEAVKAEAEKRLQFMQQERMHDARCRAAIATARPYVEDMKAFKEEIDMEMNHGTLLRRSCINGPSTFRQAAEGNSARDVFDRLGYSTQREVEKKVDQLSWDLVEEETRLERLTNMSLTFQPHATSVAMRGRKARARREAQIIAAGPYIKDKDRENFKRSAEVEIKLKTAKHPRYLTQKGAVREMVEGKLVKAVINSLRRDQRLAVEEEVERITSIIMKQIEQTRQIRRAVQTSSSCMETKHSQTDEVFCTAEHRDAMDMSLNSSSISDTKKPESTEDIDHGPPSKRTKTFAKAGQKRKRPTSKVMRSTARKSPWMSQPPDEVANSVQLVPEGGLGRKVEKGNTA